MLIKFQSEESGDIVMFGDVATQLLKMMGMSGNPEGAVDTEGVADALIKLESALAHSQASSDTDDESNGQEPNTGLTTRAVPLLEMLRRAKETNSYVMWRPE